MKNRKVMIIAIVASLSLLALVAFAGSPENMGYELFKDVMKSSAQHDVESAHVTAIVEITDNGKTVGRVEGSFDGNQNSKEVSGDVTILTDTLDKALTIYGNQDQFYILDNKNNEVYVGKHEDEVYKEDGEHRGYDRDANKSEAVLDFIVGDLAREFELVKAEDGTTDIQFELTKGEMPAILNLIVSQKSDDRYMIHDEDNWDDVINVADYPLLKELEAANIDVTDLVEDVEVTHFAVIIDLDVLNQINGLSFNVEVTGLDASGEFHTITINADLAFTEIDSAQIKKIDTEGKTIYQLPEHKRYEH
jgi:hypothetical protein